MQQALDNERRRSMRIDEERREVRSGVDWYGIGLCGVEWSEVEWCGVVWSCAEWSGVELCGME